MFNFIKTSCTTCNSLGCGNAPQYHFSVGNNNFSLCTEHFNDFKQFILNVSIPINFSTEWIYKHENSFIRGIKSSSILTCNYMNCTDVPVHIISYNDYIKFVLCRKHFIEFQEKIKLIS